MKLLSLIRDKWRGVGARSGKWRSVEKEFLSHNPFCRVCNTHKSLEVHHIHPFSKYPKLELETYNLITLCRRCHLLVGHLNDWSSYNPCIVNDAAHWHHKILARP